MGVVQYSNCASFVVAETVFDRACLQYNRNGTVIPFGDESVEEIVVLGSVHENPELMRA